MAVVAINALDPQLAQAPAGQARQIGQPFARPQGLKELLSSTVVVTKSRQHIGAHFEGLGPNTRPEPHQDVFWPGLADR
jgi:hypothetical protein